MRHFERLIDQCTYREFFMAAIDHPNKKNPPIPRVHRHERHWGICLRTPQRFLNVQMEAQDFAETSPGEFFWKRHLVVLADNLG